MKGYVKVEKSELLSAITGFELRLDNGKELLNKAIDRFYNEKYKKAGRLYKWLHRNKTPRQFASMHLGSFYYWIDVLHVVLTPDEYHELDWYCWVNKSKVDPLKALYKTTSDGYALIDDEMANFISKHKTYLENLK